MRSFPISSDHLNTFDSYYRNVLFTRDRIVIPYVSLGLIEHELNPSKSRSKFLDRCYVVLDGIAHLNLYEQPNVIENGIPEPDRLTQVYLGGRNLDEDRWVDIDVRCVQAQILVPNDLRLSDELWVPMPTRALRQNMDTTLAEELFSFSIAPEEIKQLRRMF
jgi:hypothetical protein